MESIPVPFSATSVGEASALNDIREAIRSLQKQSAEDRKLVRELVCELASLMMKYRSFWTTKDRPASVESSSGTETEVKAKGDPPKSEDPGYQPRKDRYFSLESRFHFVNPITKKSTYQQAKASIDLIREIVDYYGMTYGDCFDAFHLIAPDYESWVKTWRQINGFKFEQFWTMIEGFLLEIKTHAPARNPHHLMLLACKQTGTLEEYHEEFGRCYSLTDLDFRNDEIILIIYLHGLKPHLTESLVHVPLKNYEEAYKVLCEKKATMVFNWKGPRRGNQKGPKRSTKR